MLVFLTWSGERSKAVASALRDCLPLICNAFQPWMSEHDIAKGAPWFPEILGKLGGCGAGILCLTPENQDERWLLFEAGAVTRSVPERRLAIPYLYDMTAGELRPPLKELQAVTNAQDESENWKMVQSLFGAFRKEEQTIDAAQLRAAFDMTWTAKLKACLDAVPAPATAPPVAPAPDSSAETLTLVRELVERDRERARRDGVRAAATAFVKGLTGREAAEALAASLPKESARNLYDLLTRPSLTFQTTAEQYEALEGMEPDERKAMASMLAKYFTQPTEGGRAGASAAARPARPVVTPDAFPSARDAAEAPLDYPAPPERVRRPPTAREPAAPTKTASAPKGAATKG